MSQLRVRERENAKTLKIREKGKKIGGIYICKMESVGVIFEMQMKFRPNWLDRILFIHLFIIF